jgi:ketol-acid reductoisomerase
MRKLISDTARWGELTVGPKIIDQTVQKRMRSVLQKIRSGQFAREFIREMKTGRTRYGTCCGKPKKIQSKRSVRDCGESWLGTQKYKSTPRCRVLAARHDRLNRRDLYYLPVRLP